MLDSIAPALRDFFAKHHRYSDQQILKHNAVAIALHRWSRGAIQLIASTPHEHENKTLYSATVPYKTLVSNEYMFKREITFSAKHMGLTKRIEYPGNRYYSFTIGHVAPGTLLPEHPIFQKLLEHLNTSVPPFDPEALKEWNPLERYSLFKEIFQPPLWIDSQQRYMYTPDANAIEHFNDYLQGMLSKEEAVRLLSPMQASPQTWMKAISYFEGQGITFTPTDFEAMIKMNSLILKNHHAFTFHEYFPEPGTSLPPMFQHLSQALVYELHNPAEIAWLIKEHLPKNDPHGFEWLRKNAIATYHYDPSVKNDWHVMSNISIRDSFGWLRAKDLSHHLKDASDWDKERMMDDLWETWLPTMRPINILQTLECWLNMDDVKSNSSMIRWPSHIVESLAPEYQQKINTMMDLVSDNDLLPSIIVSVLKQELQPVQNLDEQLDFTTDNPSYH